MTTSTLNGSPCCTCAGATTPATCTSGSDFVWSGTVEIGKPAGAENARLGGEHEVAQAIISRVRSGLLDVFVGRFLRVIADAQALIDSEHDELPPRGHQQSQTGERENQQ